MENFPCYSAQKMEKQRLFFQALVIILLNVVKYTLIEYQKKYPKWESKPQFKSATGVAQFAQIDKD